MKRTSSRGRPYWPTTSASSLSSFDPGDFLAHEPQGALEIIDYRIECAVGVVRRAMEPETPRAFLLKPSPQLVQNAALADPRLTGEQHHLAFAVLRQVPALQQEPEFALPAD